MILVAVSLHPLHDPCACLIHCVTDLGPGPILHFILLPLCALSHSGLPPLLSLCRHVDLGFGTCDSEALALFSADGVVVRKGNLSV